MVHLGVNTAVLMEVRRVGVEAEVETIDTHVATEIALTRTAEEMETIIAEMVALAHVLEAQIDTIVLVPTVVIAMTEIRSQERIAEAVETRDDVQAEAQSEILLLH